MDRTNALWRIALAALVAAGCGEIAERPGSDFALRMLDEKPKRVVGQIYAPVRFAVEGCEAFDVALEDPGGARRPLSYAAQPDGTFAASVPVAWVQPASRCWPYTYEDDRATLVVTCHDAGRSARGEFALDPQIGQTWSTDYGDIRALFPNAASSRWPWWVAISSSGGEISSMTSSLRAPWAPVLGPAAYRNELVRPRLVERAGRVFATLGCEAFTSCPQVSVGPGESLPGERIADFAPSDPQYSAPRGIAHVSSNVIDMAFAEDGALVVVSDTSVGRGPPQYLPDGTWVDTDAARWGETIVWRVTPAPEDASRMVEYPATVIARFPRETTVSRLSRSTDGRLSFVSLAWPGGYSHVTVNVHVTDGATVTTRYTATGWDGCSDACWDSLQDPTFVNSGVHLSPDGRILITTHYDGARRRWTETDPSDDAPRWFGAVWPGPEYATYRQFDHGGAAWLPDAVAFWTGGDLLDPSGVSHTSAVHVYEDVSPHVLRYEYVVDRLPGSTADPVLAGVIAVGDQLVLTTRTGIRVLDSTGKLVGGVDPLPCGATVTAVAEQIGPKKVAFGVGSVGVILEVAP